MRYETDEDLAARGLPKNPREATDMALDVHDLLDAVTENRPDHWMSDEIHHTGGAGFSNVDRWPADGIWPSDAENDPGIWIWRVVWSPFRPGSRKAQKDHGLSRRKIAFGVEQGQESAAQKGRSEAMRLAKERRAEKRAA
jgi:hypothetical protein